MSHILTRKKSTASLRRKRSDSESGAPSLTTPSDQKAREEKSAPYKDARYEALLAAKGSFMDALDLSVDDKSRTLIRGLLEKAQPVLKDSLFYEDLFNSTFHTNRNKTRVIRDFSQLIVPSAEVFAIYGATALDCLIESTNEGWNNSIPVTKTRPQPDYSVGFRQEAFTETQLQKLQPFVGSNQSRLSKPV
ncbi:LOW QUALITY PROTEIN: hypothetical protein Z517_10921 [Fonsecaea pedrosoi CBS 271.37]|uniref:DUF7924 domain-containing protein n=1 Tax=Fonsecaea pedrosoi CBS 271.37 TaxID=1442368 RepID=A0A0D2GBK2_9EURO|nr:LOW QUALITY PROTEIN: uncharacterized protein Z517_10921 [Fonsecaea pedrosoi CBS 271.37]KIW76175.1 LOW QUALITY PROTEIN: hypothetical protein Z517_10921 [Fonsecaea pedrosoi CBS 271.37]